MNWFRKMLKWGLLFSLAISLLLLGTYWSWQYERRTRLESAGSIAETIHGPVEYVLKGDSGPVVLYFHGTPGGFDQAPPAGSNNRLLAFSRPGYLRTPLSAGQTPQEQAELAVSLLDILNIDSVFPAGVSGGGPAAIAFALAFPERSSGLILLEAISQPSMDEESVPNFLQSPYYSNFLLWLGFQSIVLTQGKEGYIPLLVSNPDHHSLFTENADKLDLLIEGAWGLWPVTARTDGWTNDLVQKRTLNFPFEEIAAPALVVHGTDDTNVSFSESEIVANRIPNVEFHAIEGGDHMMLLTHQEQIVELLEEFVARRQP